MAKDHYVIASRKKAQIEEKEHGKKRIVIDNVVSMTENGSIILDYGNFIESGEKKHKKCTLDEALTIVLYIVTIILILAMFCVLAVAKDFGILTSSNIDNLIGIAALLFAVVSIPRVKEILGKWSFGSRIVKKLWYVIMILVLPYFIVFLLDKVGVANSVSNICGIIGLAICIFTW